MNSKKLLIATGIYFPDIGGPASYARIIARSFSNEADISVLTYSSKFSDANDKNEKFRIVRVWRKMPKPFRQIVYLIKLFFLAGKVDTIYSLSALSIGFPAALVAKLRSKRLVIRMVGDRVWEGAMVHGKTSYMIDDFQRNPRKGWIKFLHSIQSWASRSADTIIVPSHYLAGIVCQWRVSEDKIKVVYSSTDLKESNMTPEEARTKLGIPGKIILSVGRFVPWKGFKMLIKLMPKLLEMNAFFRLVLVGGGPEGEVLKAYVKNLNLDKKVIIVPSVTSDELVTYFRAADFFILNTGYEGFSHLILESMQLEIPVITTAVGGNREIIRQGVNGFMVRYNDEFNIMEAIKTLMEDKKTKKMFIKNGKETVKQFSVERMLSDIKPILFS